MVPRCQNVNMYLPAVQIAIVYGGAGSGKTTLLEALSNRLQRSPLQISSGAIFLFGQKVRAWSHSFLQEKVYYMRQQEAPLGLPLGTSFVTLVLCAVARSREFKIFCGHVRTYRHCGTTSKIGRAHV